MRHRLLSRITHTLHARDPERGLLVIIRGHSAADCSNFLDSLAHALSAEDVERLTFLPHNSHQPRSLATLLGERDGLGTTGITLIDNLHFADQQSLAAIDYSVAQGPRPRPTVIATSTEDSEVSSATTIYLAPMSLAETANYLRDHHGLRLSADTIRSIHVESAGSQSAIDALIASLPVDHWLGLPTSSPDALATAQQHVEAGRFDSAWVYLADTPDPDEKLGAREELSSYLALYAGHRRQALDYVRHHAPAVPSAHYLTRTAMIFLADWRIADVARIAGQAVHLTSPGTKLYEESVALAAFADTVHRSHPPTAYPDLDTDMVSVTGKQRVRLFRGWTLLAQDDPLAAREDLRIFPTDTPVLRLWQDALLARTLYVLGDLAGAAESVERGLAAAEARGIELLSPLLLWTGAQTASMRGDEALSRYYLSRCVLADDSFRLQAVPAAMGRMIVSAYSSDPSVAVRAAEHLTKVVTSVDLSQPGYWSWEDIYAQTLLRAGRIDEAEEVISTAEDNQREAGLASVSARIAMVRAGIQLQRGDKSLGFATFQQAVDMVRDLPMPTYLARILFQYGQALRRYGRRSQADGIFAWAEEVYTTIGAPARVRQCRAERRAGGVGGHVTSHRGLTPQEEQIAQLVVDGETNRSIASQLTLSTKTVEYHLTSVYKKLKIQGRQQLKDHFTS